MDAEQEQKLSGDDIQCCYCKTIYSWSEDFPELTCIPSNWYCSEWCYDQDF